MAKQNSRGAELTPFDGSLISADLTITGNLKSAGELRIEGKVEGDIDCQVLTLAEGAKIDGRVVAEKASIAGIMNGDVRAATVTVAKTAHVTAKILHERLSVQPGAFIEGNVARLDATNQAGKKAEAPVAHQAGTPASKEPLADPPLAARTSVAQRPLAGALGEREPVPG